MEIQDELHKTESVRDDLNKKYTELQEKVREILNISVTIIVVYINVWIEVLLYVF